MRNFVSVLRERIYILTLHEGIISLILLCRGVSTFVLSYIVSLPEFHIKNWPPHAGVAESPLMTWGEIESTPFRLDGSDTPYSERNLGPSFKVDREIVSGWCVRWSPVHNDTSL